MKLMVIGHAFLLAYAQKKFIAMKQLDPNLQIRLVIPKQIQDRFRTEKAEIHPSLATHEVVSLGTRLSQIQGHMTYIHDPVKLARVVKEFQPDVIHIDEEPQALVTVETIAIQRALAKSAAIALFTWDNLLRPRHFPIGTVKSRLRRYSLARTSAVICGNRRAAEIVREERLFGGAVETLPQFGLDTEEHRPGTEIELRRSLGLDGAIVIGHAGRLVPEKGVLLLLEALTRLQQFPWKLLMVGGGALENEIREVWMKKFPDRIVLVPTVRYDQVAKYLRCMDIFVLSSYATPTWQEQFGLSLAQAMLLGIASIGSTSGAIPEVLASTGLLFEEKNVDGLTHALETLLTSEETRRAIADAERRLALKRYTSETVAASYLEIFRKAQRREVGKTHVTQKTVSERKE
jgi:glycosyltransferase involved in cell wall biosynthesis